MTLINDHVVRTLDQEIDTIEICPSCPNYVVIGTYSLLKQDASDLVELEDEEGYIDVQSTRQSRKGSLQILTIDNSSSSGFDPDSNPICRYDMPCAVLDIHFCPSDNTLLGVATSTGELHFFRIIGLSGSDRVNLDEVQIVPLGLARSFANHDDGDDVPPPIITQFLWINTLQSSMSMAQLETKAGYCLAACDTAGDAKLVWVSPPEIKKNTGGLKSKEAGPYTTTELKTIHTHLYGLEAWTISAVKISSTPGLDRYVLFSGGDDGCLILSTVAVDPCPNDVEEPTASLITASPSRTKVDKHTHTSGVVSILPLPPLTIPGATTIYCPKIPILTGSYDQNIRLLLFDRVTQKYEVVDQLELEGGVWRIALLDVYTKSEKLVDDTQHYVLLVSAMHAGCYVLRLTHQLSSTPDQQATWSWHVEARFKHPHESMVYACTALRTQQMHESSKTWKVISTSFYDKKVCTWQWKDSLT